MSLFKKSLKIGRRVAVIEYDRACRHSEFKTGKIVAIREKEANDTFDYKTYAVRLDDGKIGLFSARQLYTEWGEE